MQQLSPCCVLMATVEVAAMCSMEQDAFAAESHKKAAAAAAAGKFKEETVPVHTHVMDPKTKEKRNIVVAADDGIRPGTTAAGLGKLRAAFKENGCTTAGNSSQVCNSLYDALLEPAAVSSSCPTQATWICWRPVSFKEQYDIRPPTLETKDAGQ
jgi:mannitol-specific phosphotransferase system IIBC component